VIQTKAPTELLAIALDRAPNLGVYGFDNPQGGMRPEHMNMGSDEFLRQVGLCAAWIQNRTLRKTIDTRYSSYWFKHLVEREAGEYIPNGAFIAAALGMGLQFSVSHGSPNACFAFSRRSYKRRRRL